jgi:lysozyme family protein
LCEDNYSDIIRSYCDTGDVYCDVGKNNETHGSYFEKYGKEVVDFVVERYEKALKDESTSTQTSTAAATATAETSGSATASDAPSATTAAPGNAAAGLVPGLVLAMIPLALAVSEYL